jgi:hypothetical protein
MLEVPTSDHVGLPGNAIATIWYGKHVNHARLAFEFTRYVQCGVVWQSLAQPHCNPWPCLHLVCLYVLHHITLADTVNNMTKRLVAAVSTLSCNTAAQITMY